MAHDVFVSHSVKDKAIAEKVVARLEAESIRCWVAPRDVIPGADWGESIIDAIESSRIMVLIFSQQANGSAQIKREVERAVHKDVYTIPFRIEDIQPTRSLEYFISTSQWMDAFPPPLEQHFDRLAHAVKAILARTSVAVEGTSKEPEQRRWNEAPSQVREPAAASLGWRKPVALVAGLLVLGAAVSYSLVQKRGPAREGQSERLPMTDASSPASLTGRAPSIQDSPVKTADKGANDVRAGLETPSETTSRAADPVKLNRVMESSQPYAPKEAAVPPAPASIESATSSAATGISPASPTPGPVTRSLPGLDETMWNHNGSRVVLRRNGSQISVAYRQVRPGLKGIIPNGAILFEGVAEGNRYTGKARRFKKNLPAIEYDVSGGILDGGQVIELRGQAPVRDDHGTITEYNSETLRFEYRNSTATP